MQGQQIGNWIIDEKIDEGGMGEVWKAHHYLLSTTVAIKSLHRHLSNDPQLIARFKAEVIAQAKLQHPNIVRVSDFFQAQGAYYIVMPYIDGQSLEQRLQTAGGPLPKQEVLSISQDVLSALDYTHQHGVIHRDIKPANILIDQAGRAYMADFGIALMIGEERRTRTGVAIGTPHYMSPEQIVNPKQMDHRTDVYSFGCVLYEMLTGRPPFDAQHGDGDTDFIIKNYHINQLPEGVRKLNNQIPVEVEVIVLRALAKQPDDRFISCGAFARALVEVGAAPQEIIHCVYCGRSIPHERATEFCDKCGKPLRAALPLPQVAPPPGFTPQVPPKLSLEEARKYTKHAWIAATVSGAITLVVALISLTGTTIAGIDLWSLIDVGLVWGLAYGIYKYSRTCAVIMLIFFIVSRIYLWIETGQASGVPLAIVFIYWLIQGVRGTFAYHRHQAIQAAEAGRIAGS